MSGPAPNPVENELETSRVPTERAAWDAAAERCENYRRYLLGRAATPTDSEAKLLARYQQAEQTTWDTYRTALLTAREAAA